MKKLIILALFCFAGATNGQWVSSPKTLNLLNIQNSLVTATGSSFGLFLGPFNQGIYTQGNQFNQRATYEIDQTQFPNSITMSWNWPNNSAIVNASVTINQTTITINSVTSGSYIVGNSIQGLTGVPSGTLLGTLVTGTTYNMVDRNGVSVQATATTTGSASLVPCPGICGFYQISYGNYNQTVPNVPITSRQINSITTLSCNHDIAANNNLQDYDIIYDNFFTSTPGFTTSPSNIVGELEIFLTTPTYAQNYINSVTQIGTYTDANGKQWQVAKDSATNGGDILVAPIGYQPFLKSTMDIKALLTYLVTQGVITGTWYYNGHSIGIEPARNVGVVTFNSYACTYS